MSKGRPRSVQVWTYRHSSGCSWSTLWLRPHRGRATIAASSRWRALDESAGQRIVQVRAKHRLTGIPWAVLGPPFGYGLIEAALPLRPHRGRATFTSLEKVARSRKGGVLSKRWSALAESAGQRIVQVPSKHRLTGIPWAVLGPPFVCGLIEAAPPLRPHRGRAAADRVLRIFPVSLL